MSEKQFDKQLAEYKNTRRATRSKFKNLSTNKFVIADFFKKLGLTACKAEQPLQGMKLQKKKHKKVKAYRKSL